VRLTAFSLLVIGVLLAPPTFAATAPSTVFDAPIDTKTMTLPATRGAAQTKLTCSYYTHFMVKEVDEGEPGAAQLSILPGDATHKPVCQRKNVAGEKVVKADDWGGYLKGVKGDDVFFDAEDGVNGALGFAVFDSAAKKLFEDSALGNFHSLTLEGTTLTMRYQRSAAGPCSVVKDGPACWAKIATATRVAASPAPDCAAGYLKAKTEMAKGRCDADKNATPACITAALNELDAQRWNDSPSVIEYEAQTILIAGHATTTALGPALTCHPAD
jgi:hypothetical protein